MIRAVPLTKYAMSYQWDESKHPRGEAGRFSSGSGHGGAPSFSQVSLREASAGPASERRSLTRGESWQRVGAKIAELPISYTGSRTREAPVDWFARPPKIEWQAPPDMPVKQHVEMVGKLKQVVQQNRQDAIAKAKETRQLVAVHGAKDRFTLKRRTGDLILPPDTPAGATNRAYNHASMLALHDFGVLDYDFQMSDDQKKELTPLVPFMRFVRRRLWNAMRTGDLKGASKPYRAAFGQKFPKPKFDRATGAERLRVRPNDQLVKRMDIEARLAALTARRDPDGLEARKAGRYRFITAAELRAAARSAQAPTPGQIEAGNYRKGHIRIDGLGITIETAKGGMRRGIGKNGKPWRVKLPAHYGYVKRTEGADGDHVDVYLGPRAHEAHQHQVHIIDQVNAQSGAFDEHKAFLGFIEPEHAVAAYDAAFSDGLGPKRRGAVTSLSWKTFKNWCRTGDCSAPMALNKAYEESEHPRDDAGRFAPKGVGEIQGVGTKAEEDVQARLGEPANNSDPSRSGIQRAAFGAAAGLTALGGLNSAFVDWNRRIPLAPRLKSASISGLWGSAVIGAGLLSAGALASDAVALARKRPEDTTIAETWGQWAATAPMAAISLALSLFGLKHHASGLAVTARALRSALRSAPPSARIQALARIRAAAKATPGTMVWRGAPALADFHPSKRGYEAIYVATKKPVTEGYGSHLGTRGSITAYRLSPDAKLLDTNVRFPDDVGSSATKTMSAELLPLYERLMEWGGKRQLGPSKKDSSGLSVLHVNPSEQQRKLLSAHGYHGTKGHSGNVALFDTSMLTPLYAQDRAFGTVRFPKSKVEKVDLAGRLAKAYEESEHPRDEDGRWASAGRVLSAASGLVAAPLMLVPPVIALKKPVKRAYAAGAAAGAKILRAPERAATFHHVRAAAKATQGTMVWRGATGVTEDFSPVERNYNAVYVATNKRVTKTYGSNLANASRTAYRLSPEAKLLDTSVAFPHETTSQATRKMPPELKSLYERLIEARSDAIFPPDSNGFQGLSNLHTAPSKAQRKILLEAGYHGTIGENRNISLMDTSLLTPLYSKEGRTGTVRFAKPIDAEAGRMAGRRAVRRGLRVALSRAGKGGVAVAALGAGIAGAVAAAPMVQRWAGMTKGAPMVQFGKRISLADMLAKAYEESEHPRDENGHWISVARSAGAAGLIGAGAGYGAMRAAAPAVMREVKLGIPRRAVGWRVGSSAAHALGALGRTSRGATLGGLAGAVIGTPLLVATRRYGPAPSELEDDDDNDQPPAPGTRAGFVVGSVGGAVLGGIGAGKKADKLLREQMAFPVESLRIILGNRRMSTEKKKSALRSFSDRYPEVGYLARSRLGNVPLDEAIFPKAKIDADPGSAREIKMIRGKLRLSSYFLRAARMLRKTDPASLEERLAKALNPDQPRDKDGRWASAAGAAASGAGIGAAAGAVAGAAANAIDKAPRLRARMQNAVRGAQWEANRYRSWGNDDASRVDWAAKWSNTPSLGGQIRGAADTTAAQRMAMGEMAARKAFRRGMLRVALGGAGKGASAGAVLGAGVGGAVIVAPMIQRWAGMTKVTPSGCVDDRVAGVSDQVETILGRAGRDSPTRGMDPHVARMIPDVDRLIGKQGGPDKPEHRMRRNTMVGNHRIPLAHVLRDEAV